MKEHLEPHVALFPCPVVLVSVVGKSGHPNLITLAWVATVCSEPPMVGIAVCPSRFSYHLLREVPEFVVNIPTLALKEKVEWCGTNSGRGFDKFVATDLHDAPARHVRPPIVEECPVNIECKVVQLVPLGSHDLFIGQVMGVQISPEFCSEDGIPDLAKIQPFVFVPAHDRYYRLEIESPELIGDSH